MVTPTPQASQADTISRNDAANGAVLGMLQSVADTWSATGALPPDFEHRLAWVLPGDALADGWRVDSDDEQDVTRDEDTRLDLEAVLEEVAGFARLGTGKDGGAYLFVVQRGAPDYAEPLEAGEQGHDIAVVHALELSEVMPVAWSSDPESPSLAAPTHYAVTINRGGVSIYAPKVHASRLLYVSSGLRKRGKARKSDGSKDWSVGRVYSRAVADVDTGFASASRLLDRRSIPHVGLVDGANRVSQGPRNATSGASAIADYMRSFLAGLTGRGIAVTHGADTFSFQAPAVSGTPELLTSLAWRLCMVEGYSLGKLFGQPPSGLTSDDKAASKGHSSMVGKYRKNVLTPVLKMLHALIYGRDNSRRYVWPPTDEPTELEAAQSSLARAQRDSVLIQSGVITEDESRGRFEDGEEVAELRLLEQEAPDDWSPEEKAAGALPPDSSGVGPGVEKAQDTALNGAQVTAALGIVQEVVAGRLTRGMAEAMLAEFFNMDPSRASGLLDGVDTLEMPTEAVQSPPEVADGPPKTE